MQQTTVEVQTVQVPAAATPSPVATGVATAQGAQPITIPMPRTSADIRAIRAQRAELSDQLQSANRRRRSLAQEVDRADGSAKAGLEMRLTQLDSRILQLETDLASTGRMLSSPEASRLMSGGGGGPRPPMDGEAFGFGVMAGVSAIVFIGWLRGLFRGRSRHDQRVHAADPAQMVRLEQAVDAIAIEVERIAEGQRFTAKLLSEEKVRV